MEAAQCSDGGGRRLRQSGHLEIEIEAPVLTPSSSSTVLIRRRVNLRVRRTAATFRCIRAMKADDGVASKFEGPFPDSELMRLIGGPPYHVAE